MHLYFSSVIDDLITDSLVHKLNWGEIDDEDADDSNLEPNFVDILNNRKR